MSAQIHTPAQLPIAGKKGIQLARLVDGLDPQALWWLSGYSAGLASKLQPPTLAPAAAPTQALAPITVLYASQTGNARRVAERLAADTKAVERLAGLYGSDFALLGVPSADGLSLLLAAMLLGYIGAWLAVARHLSELSPR